MRAALNLPAPGTEPRGGATVSVGGAGAAIAMRRSSGMAMRAVVQGVRTHDLQVLGLTTITPPVPVRVMDLKSTSASTYAAVWGEVG